jgi:hypothetical protein
LNEQAAGIFGLLIAAHVKAPAPTFLEYPNLVGVDSQPPKVSENPPAFGFCGAIKTLNI